jgi:hypothetical protein
MRCQKRWNSLLGWQDAAFLARNTFAKAYIESQSILPISKIAIIIPFSPFEYLQMPFGLQITDPFNAGWTVFWTIWTYAPGIWAM